MHRLGQSGPYFAHVSVMHRSTLSGLAALILLAGCGRDHSGGRAGGEVSRSWNPAAVRGVEGMPVASIRSELERALGAKPPSVDDGPWTDVQRLDRSFNGSPV